MKIIEITVAFVIAFGILGYIYLQDDTQLAFWKGDTVSDNIQAREEEAIETSTDVVTKDVNYENGVYEAEAMYTVPNGTEHTLRVLMSIKDNTISAISFYFDGEQTGGTSAGSQGEFVAAMSELVVDEDIDSLELSRVGGASLTTEAFNDALAQIKTEAQL